MINKHTYIKILLGMILLAPNFQLLGQDPPDISMVFYLEEKSENGTLVGTVTATDPDGDPLTFTIISGNDLGAFAINSTSGDLTVADETQLDFEVNQSFVLMVEANDGNGGMTSVEITINLIDIPLGLDDASEKLLIYPNPVSEILHVDLIRGSIQVSEVAFYTISGSRIAISPVWISQFKMEIDLTRINTGIYILEMGGEDLVVRRRILVK